jgi:hypothetical protein
MIQVSNNLLKLWWYIDADIMIETRLHATFVGQWWPVVSSHIDTIAIAQ